MMAWCGSEKLKQQEKSFWFLTLERAFAYIRMARGGFVRVASGGFVCWIQKYGVFHILHARTCSSWLITQQLFSFSPECTSICAVFSIRLRGTLMTHPIFCPHHTHHIQKFPLVSPHFFKRYFNLFQFTENFKFECKTANTLS